MFLNGLNKKSNFEMRVPAHVVKALGLVVLFTLVCVDLSPAQVIPGRLNVLQQYRPVAPPPVPPVERLRRDIIRSVDPETGTIDVRGLAAPAPPSRPGPGAAVGFEQINQPPAPSRTGGGAGLEFSQVPTPPPVSRKGPGSGVGFQQLRPVRRPPAGTATGVAN
ncbi:MAG: hypothetical protein HY914_14080 [Desulfomonile tiedjei]|nr:hypothetical protein [Desulfomonile tiedjei]